ncbi:hypothetical protein LC612_36835 [Nostoc sp. CHAB 5834]|nr:hypothetical protein [Nostoc sp. CHAB 5834]
MAILLPTDHPDFVQRSGESFHEYFKRTQEKLTELDIKFFETPKPNVEGGVLAFPVADGRALYLVVSESPLTLQYLQFGDGYQIPAAHVRGLELEDVREHLAGRRGWHAMALKNKK